MVTSRTDKLAQALWYIAPGQAEIRQETLAPVGQGEARVRALFGALSRGTEALVFAGRVPESEHQRMRAPLMGWKFSVPGQIRLRHGRRNRGRARRICAGAMCSRFIRIRACSISPPTLAVVVPDNVPPQRAVLAANMETALNAVWDAVSDPADRWPSSAPARSAHWLRFFAARFPGPMSRSSISIRRGGN